MLSTQRIVSALATVWFATPSGHAQEAAQPRSFETPYGTMLVQQEPAVPTESKLHLWLAYPTATDDYLDQLDYILELQTRWADRGVMVAVILPTEAVPAAVFASADVMVLAPREGDEQANSLVRERMSGNTLLCKADDREVLCAMNDLDGIEDVLTTITKGLNLRAMQTAKTQLQAVIESVADGGQFGVHVTQCLKMMPKSGRAHAAKVLYHLWCQGDLDQADAAIASGIRELTGSSLPLCVFADLVLRGEHTNPAAADMIAAALAPIAAAAKHGTFAQLVYLRALLKSEPSNRAASRAAGRLAATLPKRLQGRANAQVVFAETLMDAVTPLIYRDAAERALAAVEDHPELKRWHYCARHKLLQRCGDEPAAAALMESYRKDPVGQTDLNNDAWYLMVQPETMGRFDTLAFAQASHMEEVEGERISTNNRDTLALAYFRSGQVAKAIDVQKLTNPSTNFAYLGRFTRYEATLHRQQRAAQPPVGK